MIHAVQTDDMARAHSPAKVDERLRKPASIGTRSGSSPADPQGTLNFQILLVDIVEEGRSRWQGSGHAQALQCGRTRLRRPASKCGVPSVGPALLSVLRVVESTSGPGFLGVEANSDWFADCLRG
jgi:hypothetical protein